MYNFALIGAAGFVAPRHMAAIHDTGHRLVAALDPHDSVGIIDSYAPDAHFFPEFERFDRHLDKLRRHANKDRVDYVAICSPNYLHDAHVRFALRSGADAICEKPVVLNPWNIDGLQEIEADTGRDVNVILQLRLHPVIRELRDRVMASEDKAKYDVDLTYVASRGRWYLRSWKGDIGKSGGVATNIGVHFFDMLSWVFGPLEASWVHYHGDRKAGGYLEYRRARVRWFLSVDVDDVPVVASAAGQRTYRSISVDGSEIEFSGGFSDLHMKSYEAILAGEGFGLEDSREAIATVSQIRRAEQTPLRGEYHPMLAGTVGAS